MTNKLTIKNHDLLNAAAAGMHAAAENLETIKNQVETTAAAMHKKYTSFSDWKAWYNSPEYNRLSDQLNELEKERKTAAAESILYNQRFKDALYNNVVAAFENVSKKIDGKKPAYKVVQNALIESLLFYTGSKYAAVYGDRINDNVINIYIAYQVESKDFTADYSFNLWIMENGYISAAKIDRLTYKTIMKENEINQTAAGFIDDLKAVDNIMMVYQKKLSDIYNKYDGLTLKEYISIDPRYTAKSL